MNKITKEDLRRLIDEMPPNLWESAAQALQTMTVANKYAIPAGTVSDLLECFTEQARRSIFYARCEASSSDSPLIESEHLLLGLLREAAGVVNVRAVDGRRPPPFQSPSSLCEPRRTSSRLSSSGLR